MSALPTKDQHWSFPTDALLLSRSVVARMLLVFWRDLCCAGTPTEYAQIRKTAGPLCTSTSIIDRAGSIRESLSKIKGRGVNWRHWYSRLRTQYASLRQLYDPLLARGINRK